jgi:hypothetical protein
MDKLTSLNPSKRATFRTQRIMTIRIPLEIVSIPSKRGNLPDLVSGLRPLLRNEGEVSIPSNRGNLPDLWWQRYSLPSLLSSQSPQSGQPSGGWCSPASATHAGLKSPQSGATFRTQ